MKRFALFSTALAAVFTLLLPFIGGGEPAVTGRVSSASAVGSTESSYASWIAVSASAAPTGPSKLFQKSELAKARAAAAAHPAVDTGQPGPSKLFQKSELAKARAAAAAHPAVDTGQPGHKSEPIPVVVVPPVVPPTTHKPAVPAGVSSTGGSTPVSNPAVPPVSSPAVPAASTSCPSNGGGGGSAPGGSESGISGTSSADIQSFSAALNSIRAANCLQPIASQNFRYDSCMEQRLYWMAEDPSTNPGNTWGHSGVRSLAPAADGVYYSDAVPAKGCDGNLAGGSGNTGATVAQKWWDSLSHRASLYRPSVTSTAGVCIYFAMTHGGVPSEDPGFTRAAARWGGC